LIQERVGNTLELVGIGKNFLNESPAAQQLRDSPDKWDLIKLKSFCSSKEMVSKLKGTPTEWEKILANYTADKRLITRIYRELKKLNSPKTNEPIKKWASELNRTFSKAEIQMAKKHMKKCSPSPAIKEMQIKATQRFHLTPGRTAIISNTTTNGCWRGCEEKGTLLHCWWACRLVQPLQEKIWRLLKRLDIDLPFDPAIPLLGIYPKDSDTGYSRNTGTTHVYCGTILTIANSWKQPRCPTTDEWIKKMWSLYTVQFYAARKENEMLSFAGKWMELENIILSEVSLAQKTKNPMCSLICGHEIKGKHNNGIRL
jgi:hypothetical protein